MAYATFVEGETHWPIARPPSYSRERLFTQKRLPVHCTASLIVPMVNISQLGSTVKYKKGKDSATLAAIISNGWSLETES